VEPPGCVHVPTSGETAFWCRRAARFAFKSNHQAANGSLSMLSAFINGKDIKTGTVISVVAKSVAPGETLALEYPNKSRVSGKVISASHSELELEINSEAWRLRPHAPSDSTIHNDLSDKDASFWTVQAKL
jgi:hypothetical protein